MATNDTKVQYSVLSAQERLSMARDFLRSRETDAYRAYLSRISVPGDQPRYTEDEESALKALREEVAALEKETEAAQKATD